MKAKYFLIPVILLASCQQMELENPDPQDNPEEIVTPDDAVWTLTIKASKGVETKALYLDTSGSKDHLTAYWSGNEQVTVFKDGASLTEPLTVTPDAGDKPATATLSGSITSTEIHVNDELILLIPRLAWDYSGQKGLLTGDNSIESQYDYALATVTVTDVDATTHAITTTEAHFENQQSIYRFAFRKNSSAFSIKDFKVSSAGNRIVSEMTLGGTPTLGGLTVTPASATADPLFVSIRNTGTAEDTYNFIVTGSDDALYDVSKPIPARVLDVPGKFISATTMDLTQPSFAPAGGTVSSSSEVL